MSKGVGVCDEYLGDALLLRGSAVNAKTATMPSKTEQVRIPTDVTDDGRIVAAAFGESLPEYIARVLRETIDRDMRRVEKIVAKKVKGKPEKEEAE